jgi:hypothetical protein
MTTMTTRAALAALMLAASSFALADSALAQDRSSSEGCANRSGCKPDVAARKPGAGPAVNAAVGKALTNVGTLVGQKKFPEAMVSLKEAEKAATTDYDKLKVGQYGVVVAINMGDEATAASYAEMAASVPAASIPDEEKLKTYSDAAALTANAKQGDKALVYTRQVIALNPSDARTQQVVASVMYNFAPPAEAAAYFQQRIDAALAVNAKPPRDLVDMKINVHLKANDNPGAEATLEQALALFNDPKDWEQIFNVAITTAGIRDIDAVNLGRLMFATGFPVSKDNAQLIGETAQKLALYGDSQTAVTKGAVLPLLDNARANADKASMPEQIRLGATQNGTYSVKLSEALYGYGMFPEAETAARAALTKGGIDASEAQMLIAMSLYQQGKFAESAAALGEVKGGSPATPRVVRLWGSFLKTKGVGATVAAAPAPG